ncbi:MAG: RidA family protein [Pseudomonadota bacterium]
MKANAFLNVSGQIAHVGAEIPAHARDDENDIQDQTRIAVENIKAVLDEAGYSFDNAVRAMVFMTDMANYDAFNEVHGTYWGEGDMPPRGPLSRWVRYLAANPARRFSSNMR